MSSNKNMFNFDKTKQKIPRKEYKVTDRAVSTKNNHTIPFMYNLTLCAHSLLSSRHSLTGTRCVSSKKYIDKTRSENKKEKLPI